MTDRLASELGRRDPALALQGWVYVVILAVVAAIAPFDSREILGLDPWVKPVKFLRLGLSLLLQQSQCRRVE